jgi:hypothetical protein
MSEYGFKITMSARDINELGVWEEFCDLKGYDVWCMAEGRMESGEEFSLTLDEWQSIGVDTRRLLDGRD